MADVVIRAEGLGKKYLIGHETERERYMALRDVLARTAKNLLRSASDIIRGRQLVAGDEVEEIWALKDVSFEIKRGEVVGIIGRNGAGKSTLLKILSRITEPSAGRVEIRGRVASLLEVGTGFHPELTGRENIYLNGAILGMTRAEIRRKFDDIVDFAGVENFLDTPVKRYSSGMYVRLAFAVAAHLEPEILVVDEVLAVGDAEFQKKCLGKMKDVAGQGQTVIFVSHSIPAIQTLCPRVVWFDSGQIRQSGQTVEVLPTYVHGVASNKVANLVNWHDRKGTGEARFTRIEVFDASTSKSPGVEFAGTLRIALRVQVDRPLTSPVFGVIVHHPSGTNLLDFCSRDSQFTVGTISGQVELELTVRPICLYPGRYMLSPWIADLSLTRHIDFVHQCATFDILPPTGTHVGLALNNDYGTYYLPSSWRRC